MLKVIFEIFTLPFSLFDNPIENYIAMGIIGYIAYKIAYNEVGGLRLRGETGSVAHWTIRTMAFVTFWFLCCIVIRVIDFITNNWISVIISLVLVLTLYIIEEYAISHPESILNKQI